MREAERLEQIQKGGVHMRRELLLVVLIIGLLSSSPCFLPGHAQGQAPIKLKYSNFLPMTHFVSVLLTSFAMR